MVLCGSRALLAYCATCSEAVVASRRAAGVTDAWVPNFPLTAEKIRMGCVDQFTTAVTGSAAAAAAYVPLGSY